MGACAQMAPQLPAPSQHFCDVGKQPGSSPCVAPGAPLKRGSPPEFQSAQAASVAGHVVLGTRSDDRFSFLVRGSCVSLGSASSEADQGRVKGPAPRADSSSAGHCGRVSERGGLEGGFLLSLRSGT